jgi:hypothetical protein
VRSVRYDEVVAYCELRSLTPPSETEWGNCVEVLTYMIHVRTELGIFPKIETVAKNAFRIRKSAKNSKSRAERAVSHLKELGVLSSTRRGRKGNEYSIHFDWLAEIRDSIRQLIRQREGVDPSARRIESQKMTDQIARNDGLMIRGINQEPTNIQPTTVHDGSEEVEWVAVESAIYRAGVNQAKLAVNAARSDGATPADIWALLDYWRNHRDGWERPDIELYNRLKRFERGQAPNHGWSKFTLEYQANLDRKAQWERSANETRLQLQRREEIQAERSATVKNWQNGFRLVRAASEISSDLASALQLRERQRQSRDAVAAAAKVDPHRVVTNLQRIVAMETRPP